MKVAILMGSEKDMSKMEPSAAVLEEFGVEHEVHVMSAHRTPAKVAEFASSARDHGFGAIICGAIALSQINKDPTTHKGKELAFAGIGVGALSLLVGVVFLIIALATGAAPIPNPSQFQNF